MSATTAPAPARDYDELDLLRAVVDSAPDPVWVIDGDGRVAFANTSCSTSLACIQSVSVRRRSRSASIP
ncbi:MAG: fold [Actinomycetota bacterium]|nr:fold [Actinomycetota bacterium]